MSQWQSQFKQLQINPEKNFGTSTGFEPMASVLALQCSNQLSYEDPCIESSSHHHSINKQENHS